jgi:hypothetical protein
MLTKSSDAFFHAPRRYQYFTAKTRLVKTPSYCTFRWTKLQWLAFEKVLVKYFSYLWNQFFWPRAFIFKMPPPLPSFTRHWKYLSYDLKNGFHLLEKFHHFFSQLPIKEIDMMSYYKMFPIYCRYFVKATSSIIASTQLGPIKIATVNV